jgi:hypothetical protein
MVAADLDGNGIIDSREFQVFDYLFLPVSMFSLVLEDIGIV